MMLNVADADDLMLELGHLIPAKPTRGIVQVQRIDSIINEAIANIPIC